MKSINQLFKNDNLSIIDKFGIKFYDIANPFVIEDINKSLHTNIVFQFKEPSDNIYQWYKHDSRNKYSYKLSFWSNSNRISEDVLIEINEYHSNNCLYTLNISEYTNTSLSLCVDLIYNGNSYPIAQGIYQFYVVRHPNDLKKLNNNTKIKEDNIQNLSQGIFKDKLNALLARRHSVTTLVTNNEKSDETNKENNNNYHEIIRSLPNNQYEKNQIVHNYSYSLEIDLQYSNWITIFQNLTKFQTFNINIPRFEAFFGYLCSDSSPKHWHSNGLIVKSINSVSFNHRNVLQQYSRNLPNYVNNHQFQQISQIYKSKKAIDSKNNYIDDYCIITVQDMLLVPDMLDFYKNHKLLVRIIDDDDVFLGGVINMEGNWLNQCYIKTNNLTSLTIEVYYIELSSDIPVLPTRSILGDDTKSKHIYDILLGKSFEETIVCVGECNHLINGLNKCNLYIESEFKSHLVGTIDIQIDFGTKINKNKNKNIIYNTITSNQFLTDKFVEDFSTENSITEYYNQLQLVDIISSLLSCTTKILSHYMIYDNEKQSYNFISEYLPSFSFLIDNLTVKCNQLLRLHKQETLSELNIIYNIMTSLLYRLLYDKYNNNYENISTLSIAIYSSGIIYGLWFYIQNWLASDVFQQLLSIDLSQLSNASNQLHNNQWIEIKCVSFSFHILSITSQYYYSNHNHSSTDLSIIDNDTSIYHMANDYIYVILNYCNFFMMYFQKLMSEITKIQMNDSTVLFSCKNIRNTISNTFECISNIAIVITNINNENFLNIDSLDLINKITNNLIKTTELVIENYITIFYFDSDDINEKNQEIIGFIIHSFTLVLIFISRLLKSMKITIFNCNDVYVNTIFEISHHINKFIKRNVKLFLYRYDIYINNNQFVKYYYELDRFYRSYYELTNHLLELYKSCLDALMLIVDNNDSDSIVGSSVVEQFEDSSMGSNDENLINVSILTRFSIIIASFVELNILLNTYSVFKCKRNENEIISYASNDYSNNSTIMNNEFYIISNSYLNTLCQICYNYFKLIELPNVLELANDSDKILNKDFNSDSVKLLSFSVIHCNLLLQGLYFRCIDKNSVIAKEFNESNADIYVKIIEYLTKANNYLYNNINNQHSEQIAHEIFQYLSTHLYRTIYTANPTRDKLDVYVGLNIFPIKYNEIDLYNYNYLSIWLMTRYHILHCYNTLIRTYFTTKNIIKNKILDLLMISLENLKQLILLDNNTNMIYDLCYHEYIAYEIVINILFDISCYFPSLSDNESVRKDIIKLSSIKHLIVDIIVSLLKLLSTHNKDENIFNQVEYLFLYLCQSAVLLAVPIKVLQSDCSLLLSIYSNDLNYIHSVFLFNDRNQYISGNIISIQIILSYLNIQFESIKNYDLLLSVYNKLSMFILSIQMYVTSKVSYSKILKSFNSTSTSLLYKISQLYSSRYCVIGILSSIHMLIRYHSSFSNSNDYFIRLLLNELILYKPRESITHSYDIRLFISQDDSNSYFDINQNFLSIMNNQSINHKTLVEYDQSNYEYKLLLSNLLDPVELCGFSYLSDHNIFKLQLNQSYLKIKQIELSTYILQLEENFVSTRKVINQMIDTGNWERAFIFIDQIIHHYNSLSISHVNTYDISTDIYSNRIINYTNELNIIHDRVRHKLIHENNTRLFSIYYAIHFLPNPPWSDTHDKLGRDNIINKLLSNDFFTITGFKFHGSVDNSAKYENELKSDDNDYGKGIWIILKYDITSYIETNKCNLKFIQLMKQYRYVNHNNLNEFIQAVDYPPQSYHYLLNKLHEAFPNYLIISSEKNYDSYFDDNSFNNPPTLQLFQAYPKDLCEINILDNDDSNAEDIEEKDESYVNSNINKSHKQLNDLLLLHDSKSNNHLKFSNLSNVDDSNSFLNSAFIQSYNAKEFYIYGNDSLDDVMIDGPEVIRYTISISLFEQTNSNSDINWITPTSLGYIVQIDRFAYISALQEVINYESNVISKCKDVSNYLLSITDKEYHNQQLDKINNSDALFIGIITLLSNILVSPFSTCVSITQAEMIITSEIDYQEMKFQKNRKDSKRQYFRMLSEYEELIKRIPHNELKSHSKPLEPNYNELEEKYNNRINHLINQRNKFRNVYKRIENIINNLRKFIDNIHKYTTATANNNNNSFSVKAPYKLNHSISFKNPDKQTKIGVDNDDQLDENYESIVFLKVLVLWLECHTSALLMGYAI